jgi:hypothetical protein
VARRAGMKAAPRSTPVITSEMLAKITGSVAVTPNNKLDITRVKAKAAPSPIVSPQAR